MGTARCLNIYTLSGKPRFPESFIQTVWGDIFSLRATANPSLTAAWKKQRDFPGYVSLIGGFSNCALRASPYEEIE